MAITYSLKSYAINVTPEKGPSESYALTRTTEQVDMLDKIYRLEQTIQENLDQVDCPETHHFAPGQYAREIFIPAGVVLTGAVHTTAHLTVVAKGRIKLMTEDGVQEVCAPAVLFSKPGLKRAGFALEDTVFITFHPTDETDPDKIIEQITESKASDLLGGTNNIQLEYQKLRAIGN